jgi:hypothetical protein
MFALGTSSGEQTRAARKPSSCSMFIARLLPKRSRTSLNRSSSESDSCSGFIARCPPFFLPHSRNSIGRLSWQSSASLSPFPVTVEDGEHRSALDCSTLVPTFFARLKMLTLPFGHIPSGSRRSFPANGRAGGRSQGRGMGCRATSNQGNPQSDGCPAEPVMESKRYT